MMYFVISLLLFPILFYFYLLLVESRTLWLMKFYLKLNYKVTVEGLDHLPQKGPCILVCNHFSYIDWMFLMCSLPRHVHFVIHYRFYYAKFVHSILKTVGAIPISGDGERPKLISQAFAKVSECINDGNLVLIFPEGGITRDGKIRRFKKGILKIKEACPGAPVVPVSMDGLWGGLFSYSSPGLFSFKKLKLKRIPVKIKVHPVYTKSLDLTELQGHIKTGLDLIDNTSYRDHQTYL